ncbi:Uncharacterised protein [Mycobacteroides abscessus subsp. massiliense]|nr:Uncharacterised protein [Mycobacteroides abscessus subsp. massiliense]
MTNSAPSLTVFCGRTRNPLRCLTSQLATACAAAPQRSSPCPIEMVCSNRRSPVGAADQMLSLGDVAPAASYVNALAFTELVRVVVE